MVVRARQSPNKPLQSPEPTYSPLAKPFESPRSESSGDNGSWTLKLKTVDWSRKRKALKRNVGKHAPTIIISTPLFFLLCMGIIYLSFQQENNLARLRKRKTLIKTDLIYKVDYGGELRKKGAQALWNELIEEGQALIKENPSKVDIHVSEVGMYKPRECIKAANHGLHAYCVEPSSIANQAIMHGFSKVSAEHKQRIKFYKAAAGAETGKWVPFQSGGTQGDHVGDLYDMWTMTKKEPEKHGKAWLASAIEPFLVKTIALDDIIENKAKAKATVDYSEGDAKVPIDKMFVIKVDTQGYEPEVMKGMQRSITDHKIDYIIAEYWPKGIDLMHNSTEKCEQPSQLLRFLSESGYTLYALPIVGHPKAPKAAKDYVKRDRGGRINYDDFKAYCEFFYEVEEMNPSDDYHMGYWTDVLAVSSVARLPENPVSELGRLLQRNTDNPQLHSIW